MRLTTRYNLILISVLLISLIIIGSTSYYILHKHAKEEVIKQAAVLMEAALAMRKYTINEIKPLLALQNKRNFLPQSVPSYAATQNFEALRETHSEYRYKEATLNPTNPRDRATDWETDIIQEFRNNNEANHITLVRDTPLGAMLYYARPIRIKNEGCLTCHGMVGDAPKTMVDLYGPANGFGWKMDEVVGSQIVSVPLSLPVARANETFFVLISIVTGVFLILYLMLVFFFKKLFIDQAMTLTTVIDNPSQESNTILGRNNTQTGHIAQPVSNTAGSYVSPGISERQGGYVTQGELYSHDYVSQDMNTSRGNSVRADNYTNRDGKISTGRNTNPEGNAEDEDEVFRGFDVTQNFDVTQALNAGYDRKAGPTFSRNFSSKIPEYSLKLDPADSYDVTEEHTVHLEQVDSDQISDPRTILLEEMYQKQAMAMPAQSEEFELEDVVTDLSSDTAQETEKT